MKLLRILIETFGDWTRDLLLDLFRRCTEERIGKLSKQHRRKRKHARKVKTKTERRA